MKTDEGNKLIAEFMGVTPTEKNWYDGYELHKAGLPFDYGAMGNGTYEPKFHSSWDWLMPVVEKIGAMYHVITIESNEEEDMCRILCYDENGKLDINIFQCGLNLIEATHKSVVEFIEWYNKQN